MLALFLTLFTAPIQEVETPAPPPGSGTATLIVLNKSDDTASLVDPATGKTRAVVKTGAGPHEVAVTEDGALAVVADYGHDRGGSTLSVIDVERAALVRTIDLGEFRRPHGLVFVPGTQSLLVTCEAQQSLVEVDVASGEIVQAVRTEASVSHMVAVAAEAGLAFVANIGSGSVSVIDLVQGVLAETIPTGEGCEGIDVGPGGEEVWVTNRAADTVSVIDVETLEITATLEAPGFPIRVKLTPDGKRALVSCARAEELVVFDVEKKERVGSVPMRYEASEGSDAYLFGSALADKAAPIGILIQPDGKRAYVANTNADAVSVVDLETLRVVGTIRAGRQPDGLGWAVPR